jgi:hypothetical protein
MIIWAWCPRHLRRPSDTCYLCKTARAVNEKNKP